MHNEEKKHTLSNREEKKWKQVVNGGKKAVAKRRAEMRNGETAANNLPHFLIIYLSIGEKRCASIFYLPRQYQQQHELGPDEDGTRWR